MSLNFRRRFGKDWEVSALANLTYAHNKIVEIDEADAVKGTYRSKTGKPVSQLFGLVAERLFTKTISKRMASLNKELPLKDTVPKVVLGLATSNTAT